MRRALLGIGLALIVVGVGSSTPVTELEVGRPTSLVPIAIRDADGGETSTRAFAGKWLVLNVWATWCAPCRRELLSLVRLRELRGASDLAVVGLSMDRDPDLAREYVRQRRLDLPNYVPLDRRAALVALHVEEVPTTLIVAPDGSVVAKVTGPRQWDHPAIVAELDAVRRARAAR